MRINYRRTSIWFLTLIKMPWPVLRRKVNNRDESFSSLFISFALKSWSSSTAPKISITWHGKWVIREIRRTKHVWQVKCFRTLKEWTFKARILLRYSATKRRHKWSWQIMVILHLLFSFLLNEKKGTYFIWVLYIDLKRGRLMFIHNTSP